MTNKIFKTEMTVIALVLIFVFVSCGGNNSKLAGNWVDEDGEIILELFKDGTGRMEGERITWKDEKNRLIITDEEWGDSETFYYKLSGSTLTFTEGGDFILERPASHYTRRGTLTFDSAVYEGDIVNGTMNGKGKYTWTDGAVYEGDFFNGDFHGKGKYTWVDGEVYEGDYVYDKRTGKGKYTFANGNVYEGDFDDGKQTGKGKYTYADGTVYVGDFDDGDFNGRGKMTYTDGRVEEGNWKDDEFIGQ
jgi:hypothetical protein